MDELTRDEMREYRGNDAGKPSRPSPWRDRTPEENLDLFRRMRAGEFQEGEKTLRAKIDLASPNMNLRDPAIYRIKYAEHHRQGSKWCIYPMYDFAHPIQDAIEGITHSMCSLEFENHRPLYNWVIENIFGTEFPKQREFARLNMTNTVMSKRYLRELVEMGIVDGWDDPRMPTLCGLRRRGYTPTSIFTFVREAGISKSDNLIDMRQLEACIRSELDLTAQRRIAVLDPVKLIIDNYPEEKTEYFDIANNPNREANDATTRKVAFTRELWIENEDFAEVPPPKFKRLTIGGEVRLMGAYLVKCESIEKKPDGGEHLMIMYRRSKYILLDSGFFWISPTPECPSRGWDAMCRRVTVWVQLKDRKTGKEFFYFDTHFDHIGKQARAESARMMVARMKRIAGEKAAVFLSGDLNTTYDNALLDPLKAWMQSARHAAPVTDELPTFNDFGKRSLWIDFIFARNARALAYRTLVDSGRYGVPFLSDHNPVYALYKL